MRVNQVVVIPEFYSGKGYGRIFEKVSEFDGMISYLHTLCDALDDDGIRYTMYNEADPILPHTLLIHASIGWFEPNKKGPKKCISSNISTLSYGKGSTTLAKLFSEAMSDWGKCYVDFHHKTAEPKSEPKSTYLNYENTFSVSVSPFMVNAPNAEKYVEHAPVLGKMLANCIHEFVQMRKQDITFGH